MHSDQSSVEWCRALHLFPQQCAKSSTAIALPVSDTSGCCGDRVHTGNHLLCLNYAQTFSYVSGKIRLHWKIIYFSEIAVE